MIFRLFAVLTIFAAPLCVRGISWQRGSDSLALQAGKETIWQFNFATNQGKPFFHPLRVTGGHSLTALKPSDHPWHYGLWFSWKYINGVNYWEEDKKTGRAQGLTIWDKPEISTHPDGSAQIKMTLRYLSVSNAVLMTEQRLIEISATQADGGVTIDWKGQFTVNDQPLLLDRTHMPGEPNGAVNGGYAGFSLRAAQSPAQCQFVTIEGPVEKFESDRARPNSTAAACNITQNGRTDGVAILSYSSNLGGDSPWYIINSAAMHWFSPALLAPAPKNLKPHQHFTWQFRVMTTASAWTPEQLRAESLRYNAK
jgi:hypothetical protein